MAMATSKRPRDERNNHHYTKKVRTSPAFSDYNNSSDTSGNECNGDKDGISRERRMAEALKTKFSTHQENVPVDNGIIERVDCHNFMCHELFSVELGPLINFVVGKNGSGKSAVLTAITLCLGGKTSATNRGQSLKNFIKEGKDSSTIVVRIKNQGDTAYLPNEYGKSIIVERHFSRSGASGFKLKNENGRIMSTKKGDLDSITDYFALQIDNPMNVLSQDMARQFLSISNPSDKYKSFVKGVQLEQLDQDYKLIEETLNGVEGKLSIRAEEVRLVKARMDRANGRLESSERQAGLRTKAQVLRGQSAWAQVEEQERNRDSWVENVTEIRNKINAVKDNLAKSDEQFQHSDQEQELAMRNLEEGSEILRNRQEEYNTIREEYDDLVKARHEIQAQQRDIRESLKTNDSSIEDLKAKIEQEQQRLADMDDGSNARHFAELEERKSMVSDIERRIRDCQSDTGRLESDFSRAEEERTSLSNPITKYDHDLRMIGYQISNLERVRCNCQEGFPENMPNLLQTIRREARLFAESPIGPLGSHIKLLKPKWTSILETTLGQILTAFVVTSKHDSNVLSDIMKKEGCDFPILIANQNRSQNSLFEPDAQFDTILRVLEIDNELIRRQLINTHGIEQVVLIENVNDAAHILFDRERPRNVKRCYSIDENDRRKGFMLTFNRKGDPTQSPISAFTGRPRMKTDIEYQISMQQEAYQKQQGIIAMLREQFRQACSHVQQCQYAIKNQRKEIRRLESERQKAEDVFEALQNEIERDSNRIGRLDSFNSDLRELEEERDINKGSYDDSVNALDNVKQDIENTKTRLISTQKGIVACQERVKNLETELSRCRERRQRALGNKNAIDSELATFETRKLEAEQEQTKYTERILDFCEKAKLVSKRLPVPPDDSAASLNKKLERLMRDITRSEQQMGASREEIATEAQEATRRFQQARAEVEELEGTAQTLKASLVNRQERWKSFRAHITSRAKLQFGYLLSERSYRGRLLADHSNKLLDIQVEPDITKDSSAGRGAKTLSGGEKSFSQICLLLALWEAMGSPIRCLDEFDVFMDVVNRKTTIDMLMVAARRSVGRQFILITPGSRSEITPAPDVTIKELAEPLRGQARLAFPTR